MKLIDEWKLAYKFLSVQLAALVTIVAGLEPFVPQLQAQLPAHWFPFASGAILLARIVKQASIQKTP